MINKFYLEDGIFYITNVCNLTCDHCESYNNRNFKGHFLWETHAEQWKEWSNFVDLERINIHGGEPFTNPDLINWAKNLLTLWPNASEKYISSNGTLLHAKIDLCRELIDIGWNIDVVVHDPAQLNQIVGTIKEIIKPYTFKILYTDPKKKRIEFRDEQSGKLLISLEQVYHFIQKSQRLVEDGVIYMHRSNGDKAFKICQGECIPAGYFVNGGIYHCYLTSLTSDLTSQFKFEQYAETLLKEYKPCLVTDSQEEKDLFFSIVGKKSIKQCTLCPDKEVLFPIFPLSPKKKLL
jgi:organic radical activating enzyme